MKTADQRARAALWSIRGVGPVTLRQVEAIFGAPGELLDSPVERWCGAIEWRGEAAARLHQWGVLARVADALEARCRATGQTPVFPGDDAWPSRLDDVEERPPVLFLRGPGAAAAPRRRVAFVGSRSTEPAARERAHGFSRELAAAGLGVISGAAVGIDQAAHRGALEAAGESWAFLGCAIDQLDAGQRAIAEELEAGGGSLFSQFPPGCRANQSTFTQRNTLVSGASDAVLVYRAKAGSGALYTAAAAIAQRRPVLACPADPWNPTAAGSNALLREGARVCLEVRDVLEAVGLEGALTPPRLERSDYDPGALSARARRVLAALGDGPLGFEGLEGRAGLEAGALSATLVELELLGAVVERPGRRYEKR